MKTAFRLLAVAFLGITLVTSCMSRDEKEIRKVSMDFLTAFDQADFEQAKTFVTEDSKKQIDAMASLLQMLGGINKDSIEPTKFEILTVTIRDNEKATVSYKSVSDEKEAKEENKENAENEKNEPATLNLEKVDGKWLVKYTKDGYGDNDDAHLEHSAVSRVCHRARRRRLKFRLLQIRFTVDQGFDPAGEMDVLRRCGSSNNRYSHIALPPILNHFPEWRTERHPQRPTPTLPEHHQ